MWEVVYSLFLWPLWLLHFFFLLVFWGCVFVGIYITIGYYINKWKNRKGKDTDIDDYYNYM